MNRDETNHLSPFEIDQLSKSGSVREALNLALKEIRAGSRESDLFYLAARLAFEIEDLGKSEQLVKHLLALDPEHLSGWVLFGRIHRMRGDLARSNYAFQRAQELFPALSEYDLLDDLKAQEMPRTGLSSGMATISREIFETETYADICVKQGYFNKALKIYTDLREKFPDNAGIQRKIEETKKKMGRND
jgi:tetratricopeptide (TPR) repeat protein